MQEPEQKKASGNDGCPDPGPINPEVTSSGTMSSVVDGLFTRFGTRLASVKLDTQGPLPEKPETTCILRLRLRTMQELQFVASHTNPARAIRNVVERADRELATQIECLTDTPARRRAFSHRTGTAFHGASGSYTGRSIAQSAGIQSANCKESIT